MKTLFATLLLLSSLQIFAIDFGSPWTDVQYDASPSVKVEVDGEIYYLLSVNGVRREAIVASCLEAFGADCPKLFAEDFVATMTALGYEIGETVDLSLYFMANHSVQAFDGVPVTEENQELVIQNRMFRGE